MGARISFRTAQRAATALTDHLGFSKLEDATIPLHVVATDGLSGQDVLLSSGNAVDAIAAIASIPTVLPPVDIAGWDLIDGGVVNNTPSRMPSRPERT